jgi:hypothetical protein
MHKKNRNSRGRNFKSKNRQNKEEKDIGKTDLNPH